MIDRRFSYVLSCTRGSSRSRLIIVGTRNTPVSRPDCIQRSTGSSANCGRIRVGKPRWTCMKIMAWPAMWKVGEAEYRNSSSRI
jgi:hypothetical protein